jgi:hypothetical protein
MASEPTDDELARAGVDDAFIHMPCASCWHRSTSHMSYTSYFGLVPAVSYCLESNCGCVGYVEQKKKETS